MNATYKILLTLLAVGLVSTLTFGYLNAPVEASSAVPFYCCIDGCDAAWAACSAACPPNTPMCELACNNQWWDCNWACAGAGPRP